MKRNYIILSVLSIAFTCFLFSCSIKRSYLSNEQLERISDSITAEARVLYVYEKNSWQAEDALVEHCSNLDQINGNIDKPAGGMALSTIYYNYEDSIVYFECFNDVINRKFIFRDTIRKLTQNELDSIAWKIRIVEAGKRVKVDIDYPNATFNKQFINVGNGIVRTYCMMGTSEHGVIPFGNDYSYDTDDEGNLIASRRYHGAYLPTPVFGEEGNPVEMIFHTHIDYTNPWFTPTDLCLYWLYCAERGLNVPFMIANRYGSMISTCGFDASLFE